MHTRIGDVVKQDKAATWNITHKLVEELENNFLAEQQMVLKNKS